MSKSKSCKYFEWRKFYNHSILYFSITIFLIQNYGNHTTANTSLNKIYEEYKQRISAAAQIVQSINSSTTIISTNLNSIQESLNNTSNQIGSLTASTNSFGSVIDSLFSIVDKLLIQQTQVKKNGLTAFYVLFGLILGLDVLNILGALLFGIFKFQIFRYFNHIAWFILAFIIILIFILGSVFAIFGILGQDLSSSFINLFSPPQIFTTFSSNYQAAQLLNVCINDNGDIANKVFNFSSGNVGSIATLQNASNSLSVLARNLSNNTNSISIPILNSLYNNYINDITLVTLTAESVANSPATVLTNWYPWSDTTFGTYGMSKCSAGLKDRWVQNITRCPSGYQYNSPSSAGTGQSCLLISDWNPTVNDY